MILLAKVVCSLLDPQNLFGAPCKIRQDFHIPGAIAFDQ